MPPTDPVQLSFLRGCISVPWGGYRGQPTFHPRNTTNSGLHDYHCVSHISIPEKDGPSHEPELKKAKEPDLGNVLRVFTLGSPTILFLAFSLPFQQPENSKNSSGKNPTGKAGTLDSHLYGTFRAMGLKIRRLKGHIYVSSSQEHVVPAFLNKMKEAFISNTFLSSVFIPI